VVLLLELLLELLLLQQSLDLLLLVLNLLLLHRYVQPLRLDKVFEVVYLLLQLLDEVRL
jgi:hypothetical protein